MGNIKTPATWRNTFIVWLVQNMGWTCGAELGVWKGDTFLHVLNACPNLTLYGVDLWAPQPGHDGPEDWAEWDHKAHERRVREGSRPFGDRAKIIKALTADAAKQIPDGTLDFVFIDADHSTAGVKWDIHNWGPKLKDSGWFIGHDIDWPSVRKAVDEELPGYETGPNVTWFRPKNPEPGWQCWMQ